MLLKNKNVAVIGAGPVGLTIAKLLQQKGVKINIYERDKNPQARVWGGTLDLHKNTGQDAMEKMGLLQKYFELAVPMGRTLANIHGKVFFTKEPEIGNPEINRNVLRQMLLSSLTDETVLWDRRFVGIEAHNGKWLLHFEDKPSVTADLVIGANGGMSNIRNCVTDIEVEHTETFIIQGEVTLPETRCPDFFQLCNGNILMTASNGITLVANPKNNGALGYAVTFNAPELCSHKSKLNFQNCTEIANFLSGMLSQWHEFYKQLFYTTTSFVGLPSRILPLDKAWNANRELPITLIGDAAHIMPPFAGQGVNIGLLDAIILSDNLTNGGFDTTETAITDYEQKMFIYAKEAQLETVRNERDMHLSDFSFEKRFKNQSK